MRFCRKKTVKIRGRKITLGECEFIFNRVWDLTVEKDSRNPEKIYINDLFHILDLAGTLMNKAEPGDNDPTPFQEFNKHAKEDDLRGHGHAKSKCIKYVEAQHLPHILLLTFIGQPDQKRIDAGQLIQKYGDASKN